jgi:hypothetical protein
MAVIGNIVVNAIAGLNPRMKDVDKIRQRNGTRLLDRKTLR